MKLHLAVFILCLAVSQNLEAKQTVNQSWQAVEGQHYLRLDQAPETDLLSAGTNIKFYYWPGSASSYQLELALQDYSATHPEITIQRIPLVMRPHWRLLAKACLVAEDMQQGPSFLDQLYRAIHIEAKTISNETELEQLLLSLEIDPLDFFTRFNSLETNQRLKLLQKQSASFPIKGVPTIIINNRWISDASIATTSAQLISVIEQLSLTMDETNP